MIHYGDTTGKVLQTLYDETQNGASGSGYVSAVALEETSLLNYNQGNPDSHTVQPGEKLTPPKEKLVAVYPSGGSMWSDNPAVVLGAPMGDSGAAGRGPGVPGVPEDRARAGDPAQVRVPPARRVGDARQTSTPRSASTRPSRRSRCPSRRPTSSRRRSTSGRRSASRRRCSS